MRPELPAKEVRLNTNNGDDDKKLNESQCSKGSRKNKLFSFFASWFDGIVPVGWKISPMMRRSFISCGVTLIPVGYFFRSAEEKSNEITAIPELLDQINVSGCVVTIDAIATQKKIVKKIIDKNADDFYNATNNSFFI